MAQGIEWFNALAPEAQSETLRPLFPHWVQVQASRKTDRKASSSPLPLMSVLRFKLTMPLKWLHSQAPSQMMSRCPTHYG
ncbi:hypothetical protein [Streptomyces hirsutus]|uniref:hypothetical protein n=1 Tax=Streptomyces hirsutus TaxID=35620 RepID=UPI003693CE9B